MLLKIDNLRVKYDIVTVLRDINIQIPEYRIVSLIGANGSGKSTLLKTISGLLKPTEGEIVFKNRRIDGLTPAMIVQSGIAQVPEGGRIFSKLTVQENLITGASQRKDKAKVLKDFERIHKHFPVLAERAKQKAGTLSGGERQMLAFARALMNGPKLLMLDEPSLGLSPIMVDTIFDIIKTIKEEGVTILLVEQNARMAMEISDYTYVFATGRVVLQGPSAELLDSEKVRKAYIGGR